MDERLFHAKQREGFDIYALVVTLLQGTTVRLARNGSREFRQHQDMLRVV